MSVTMNPGTVETEETRAVLSQTLAILKRETATTSAGDPWAWADLLLISALQGDVAQAEDAFHSLKALNPVADVYTSGLPVLQRLSAALSDNGAIRRAVGWYEDVVKSAQKAG